MARFFIERPVFAWVLSIFIIIGGLLALPRLPVERFPTVAPPSVSISATFPGATPQTLSDSVIAPIERELSSVKNLLYFESSSDTSGSASITATFKPGTDPELAQVDVQNRLKNVEAGLPQVVRQNGLMVDAASSNFLLMVALNSDGPFDEQELGDYLSRNLVEELKRVPGVGKVQNFASERAMRIWIDPQKMAAYNIAIDDLTAAIAAQNMAISPGKVGEAPTTVGQMVTVPLTASGQLETSDQFRAITLRANPDGSRLTLGDVARVELGQQSYAFASYYNGKPSAVAAIQLSPGANSVAVSDGVIARMEQLKKAMPPGMSYSVPFNNAPFVKVSIEKVVHTLIEAMVLVFLVMFLFLQNIRYTLIPAIVAPIALLGTLAVMTLTGFSINVLTMFGMVLAIGIIVDDAIVVVENVERIMASEGLSPKDATIKAMKEITSPVIGITLVLAAVFIPMAFSAGTVGVIYRQFTLSMAVSILFSAFLALSLTPALCATLLKPIIAGHHQEKKGFFGWFNRRFDRLTYGYTGCVTRLLGRTGTVMAIFLVILGFTVFTFIRLPSAFLPDEDQGQLMTSITLPSDATAERTRHVTLQYEREMSKRPGIEGITSVMGFGFGGSGPNAAMIFTNLVDWDKRHGATSQGEAAAAAEAMASVRDGTVMTLLPPAIDSLGSSAGFELRLQAVRGQSIQELNTATNKLLTLAAQSPKLAGVYPDGLPEGASVDLRIDRAKAEALGVSFDAINNTISAALGSSYVNDFPNNGRMQQVIVQADAKARMQVSDVLALYVRNRAGGMVPLAEVVQPQWRTMPMQLVRYNGFPAASISGGPAVGVSSGQAMAEMERLVAQLPQGFNVAWTGASLQEQQSGNQAPMLLAFSMLVVFLVLAALYESWSIPLSVMMVVPLGVIGAVLAVTLRGMPNDVFFKVGLITIIGLSAKNAILIVEFARKLRLEEGKGLIEATIEACRRRLRPIIMTSLAFTLGVVPLMVASGASAATQQAIGTGVFGGMITATVLAVFFVPVFFVFTLTAIDHLGQRIGRSAPVLANVSKGDLPS